MYKLIQEYSEAELIQLVWDRENVQEVMNRRVYLSAAEGRERELGELWVSGREYQETASFGKNWGYYIGMAEIRRYYVDKRGQDMRKLLDAMCTARPELKDESPGYGCMSLYPLTTPYIEIAGDGRTARGLWYSIGQETTGNPKGTAKAYWIFQRIAADLVKEGEAWKIWHLAEIFDAHLEPGEDFRVQPRVLPKEEQPVEREFGEPTLKMLTHDARYNWLDGYPAMPEPYYSFKSSDSYGPEGHPHYYREVLAK